MAVLEALMKVMAGSIRELMGRAAEMAVWVEKQWYREGCWW